MLPPFLGVWQLCSFQKDKRSIGLPVGGGGTEKIVVRESGSGVPLFAGMNRLGFKIWPTLPAGTPSLGFQPDYERVRLFPKKIAALPR